MDLFIERTVVADCPIMSARGELDLATVPRLHSALNKFVDDHAGRRIIVDLDGLTACDDAGLGVLLGAAGRARQGSGELVVVSSDGPLRTRLGRTGFDRAIEVYASITDAVHTER